MGPLYLGNMQVRWFSFVLIFFALVFGSFWSYTWLHKRELIVSTIEQACVPYSCSLENVQVQIPHSLILHNISFSDKNVPQVNIDNIVLAGNFRDWLYWILSTSKKNLHINKAQIHIHSFSKFTCSQPNFPFSLSIDVATIYWPNGDITIKEDLSGPLHELLNEILKPVVHESSPYQEQFFDIL